MTEILIYVGSIVGGLFLIIWKAFSSGKNIGKNEIKNEQNEIENEQFKEQIEGIQEWKRTNDHIDSLSPDNLASKLQAWSRAEKKDHQ